MASHPIKSNRLSPHESKTRKNLLQRYLILEVIHLHEPRRNAMKEDTGSLLDELKRRDARCPIICR